MGTPKARLVVQMTPATLKVDQPGALNLWLSNGSAEKQTVAFTLNYPSGAVSSSDIAFSAPCTTLALSMGGQSLAATVVVPASTERCMFEFQKRFTQEASPVVFTLSGLDRVEQGGALPSVTGTDSSAE